MTVGEHIGFMNTRGREGEPVRDGAILDPQHQAKSA
jgi:hypothetical protein